MAARAAQWAMVAPLAPGALQHAPEWSSTHPLAGMCQRAEWLDVLAHPLALRILGLYDTAAAALSTADAVAAATAAAVIDHIGAQEVTPSPLQQRQRHDCGRPFRNVPPTPPPTSSTKA